MALPTPDSKVKDYPGDKRQLARFIVRAYDKGEIAFGSSLHDTAGRFRNALLGDHNLITDLRLQFFINADGSEDAKLVEAAKRLGVIIPDFRRLAVWLAANGGVKRG